MKRLILYIFSIAFCVSAFATRHFINQLPVNGNAINLIVNNGDTVEFNLPDSYSIRQVSESAWRNSGTTQIAGGFSLSGSGQIAIAGAGIQYFVMVSTNGRVSKGTITSGITSAKSFANHGENPIETRMNNERLQISIRSLNASGSIALYDILGNKLIETPANDNIEVTMAGYRSGAYFVVWKDNKMSFTKRFIYRSEN